MNLNVFNLTYNKNEKKQDFKQPLKHRKSLKHRKYVATRANEILSYPLVF